MSKKSNENLAPESANSTPQFFDNLNWLSTKDAAIFLRKFRKNDGEPSEGAIRNLVWRGILKARKWRRRIYFKRSDLERLLQMAPSYGG